jgi:hypothetical protein
MEWSSDYCWVVICKNHRVHHKGNTSFEHRIVLAETDSYSPLPMMSEVKVRCDACGEEYSYKPKEVLRAEINTPANFEPHPLFRHQA